MALRLSAYAARDLLLVEAGYLSYREYLLSDTWWDIRAAVLDARYYCETCESRASQVHHVVYNHENLFGNTNHPSLVALCRRCHRWLEFSRSKKGTIEDAAHKLCWKLLRLKAPVRAKEILKAAGLTFNAKRYACPRADILKPPVKGNPSSRKSKARKPSKRVKSKKC